MTQDEADALTKELQNAIDALVKNPTIIEVKEEPAHKAQVVGNKTKTGDNTAIISFVVLALISAVGLLLLRKKKTS